MTIYLRRGLHHDQLPSREEDEGSFYATDLLELRELRQLNRNYLTMTEQQRTIDRLIGAFSLVNVPA